MNRLITICVLTAFILAFSSPANAVVTVDTVTSPSPPFDDYRYYNEDFGWAHSFSPLPASINSATLQIRAWDVNGGVSDPEEDEIFLDSYSLGLLVGSHNTWSITTFNLDATALSKLMDGTANMWIDIDRTHSSTHWAVTVDWSKLTVDYTPIPAPGAILLGSIGVGLVGWLRRRRTL